MDTTKKTDIKDKKEFVAEDCKLKQVEYCEESGRYLYERYFYKDCKPEKVGMLMGYEIVQPKKMKQPDGSDVFIYPSSSDFGKNGWFLPANSSRDMINFYLLGYNKTMDRQSYQRMISSSMLQ